MGWKLNKFINPENTMEAFLFNHIGMETGIPEPETEEEQEGFCLTILGWKLHLLLHFSDVFFQFLFNHIGMETFFKIPTTPYIS